MSQIHMNPFGIRQKTVLQLLSALLLAVTVGQVSAAPVVSYDDPWEKTNRAIFKFNDTIDTYALKPVAKGYDKITPKPVQNMVGNFFSNLGELRNTANALLQFKGKEAIKSLGRFGINSTVGMLGLIDVATPLGIEKQYEDFGLTLAHWGAPSGPYVVLPFLGPKTVRSGIGLVPDSAVDLTNQINPERDRWIARGGDVINTRAELLGAEDLIMGDRYSFIRDAYLQRREYLITGMPPEDDF